MTYKEERNLFEYKKNRIFQSPKNRIFPKGVTHAFDQKMSISCLFRFDQNNNRNNA